MENIEELKKRVENIEYKDIKGLRDDLTNVKISLEKNNVLTQQNAESNEKLNDTLGSMKDAMVELSTGISLQNRNSEAMVSQLESMGARIGDVESKVDSKFKEVHDKIEQIDNKTKIDTSIVVKDWILKMLAGGTVCGAFVAIMRCFEM